MADDSVSSIKQLSLPEVPGKAGMYVQCKRFSDNMLYLSGCGPDIEGEVPYTGKLKNREDVVEAQFAAENCVRNALSILKKELGSLEKIKSFVKMLVFVASDDEFYFQPAVADGASRFLTEVFGEEKGCPARSAIGVNVLPGNIPVEIELLVELK